MQGFIQTNMIWSFNSMSFYCTLVICFAIIGSGHLVIFTTIGYWRWLVSALTKQLPTVGIGGGQEMTKTVKLKRFYCHGQISALGTNSSKLVEIRMMTLKNHQSTAGPVPTCYTPPWIERWQCCLPTHTTPISCPSFPPMSTKPTWKVFICLRIQTTGPWVTQVRWEVCSRWLLSAKPPS